MVAYLVRLLEYEVAESTVVVNHDKHWNEVRDKEQEDSVGDDETSADTVAAATQRRVELGLGCGWDLSDFIVFSDVVQGDELVDLVLNDGGDTKAEEPDGHAEHLALLQSDLWLRVVDDSAVPFARHCYQSVHRTSDAQHG
jgi:hypothetical protein